MIFLMYIQNLTTIGPVVSEIMCLVKIDTDDRESGRQIDENGRPLDHYTSIAYAQGVKIKKKVSYSKTFRIVCRLFDRTES